MYVEEKKSQDLVRRRRRERTMLREDTYKVTKEAVCERGREFLEKFL